MVLIEIRCTADDIKRLGNLEGGFCCYKLSRIDEAWFFSRWYWTARKQRRSLEGQPWRRKHSSWTLRLVKILVPRLAWGIFSIKCVEGKEAKVVARTVSISNKSDWSPE